MKATKKKRRNAEISPEEAMKQLQKIFKKRGIKALEMARKEILKEKIECKEAREALRYFMTEYWKDLARPTLLSLACEAIGGDPELTTPIAVPMILISGAIDIHDDIIDQSKVKNRHPTVYGKFEKDIALLVGDALLFEGLTLLHEAVEKGVPAEKITVIIGIIRRTFFELGDAEALELHFRGRRDITPEEYVHVVRKKAADVEAHTRISAVLGGGSNGEIEALSEYGRLLGMLIILRDDLMDLIDLKEISQRIKRESLPLPILYALQDPKIKPILNSVLSKEMITKKDAERILELIHKAGGIKYLERFMQELANRAYLILDKIGPNRKYLKLFIQSTTLPFVQMAEFH